MSSLQCLRFQNDFCVSFLSIHKFLFKTLKSLRTMSDSIAKPKSLATGTLEPYEDMESREDD